MDLVTYWQVVQRRRKLMLCGLGVTFVLVLVTLVRVTPSGVSLRSPAVFSGTSTLFVTQKGFPWGRSSGNPRSVDPSRMEYLADLYADIAMSNVVLGRVERRWGKLPDADTYEVGAVARGRRLPQQEPGLPTAAPDSRSLPLIEVVGFSPSRGRAVALANHVAVALRAYVEDRQQVNKIPPRARILLPSVTQADRAKVVKGVQLTAPIMIALLGVIGTLFIAFTADNLERQRRLAEALSDPTGDEEQQVHHLAAPSEAEARTGTARTRTRR